MLLRKDAERIMNDAIAAVLPQKRCRMRWPRFLYQPKGSARAAGGHRQGGLAYGESCGGYVGIVCSAGWWLPSMVTAGALPRIEIVEAGHPVPDENSCFGAQKALELVANLSAQDVVLLRCPAAVLRCLSSRWCR